MRVIIPNFTKIDAPKAAYEKHWYMNRLQPFSNGFTGPYKNPINIKGQLFSGFTLLLFVTWGYLLYKKIVFVNVWVGFGVFVAIWAGTLIIAEHKTYSKKRKRFWHWG